MDEDPKDGVVAVMEKETWTAADCEELSKRLSQGRGGPAKFRASLAKMEAESPDPKGAAALKIGVARYMLCRFDEALDAFGSATDNKDRRYFQALCYKQLKDYPRAIEELGRAKDRGWDATEIELGHGRAANGTSDHPVLVQLRRHRRA